MDKIIILSTFLNTNEAHIVKGLLESHGIESYMFDEFTATAMPPLLVGGVRLAVKQSDLERALAVLKNTVSQ